VDSSFFKETFYSPRPDNERLENTRLNYKGLNIMQTWQSALREYLDEWDDILSTVDL